MFIRNPNSTFFYRAHFRLPVTMCTAPPPLRFSASKMFAQADGSFTVLHFGFSSPYCPEVFLNRSIVAFAASHENSVTEQSGVEHQNIDVEDDTSQGKEKRDIDVEDDTSQEAWKKTL